MNQGRVALIHVARSRLAMTETEYRNMLRRIADVSSSKDLTDKGFADVMDELRRRGFESTGHQKQCAEESRRRTHATSAQRHFMRKLWTAWKGRDDPDGFRRWLAKHFGCSHPKFISATLAPKVIAALCNFKPRRDPAATSAPPENTPTA